MIHIRKFPASDDSCSLKIQTHKEYVLHESVFCYIHPKCLNASIIAVSLSGGHSATLLPSSFSYVYCLASPHFSFILCNIRSMDVQPRLRFHILLYLLLSDTHLRLAAADIGIWLHCHLKSSPAGCSASGFAHRQSGLRFHLFYHIARHSGAANQKFSGHNRDRLHPNRPAAVPGGLLCPGLPKLRL